MNDRVTAARILTFYIDCGRRDDDFIALVSRALKDEREACAKIAESEPFIEARDTEFDTGVNLARKVIASAIRNCQK